MVHQQPSERPVADGVSCAAVICSAKGCRASADWALRWNNPKLHPPTRRKIWLACEKHRESLSGFLDARGFLREVTKVDHVDPASIA